MKPKFREEVIQWVGTVSALKKNPRLMTRTQVEALLSKALSLLVEAVEQDDLPTLKELELRSDIRNLRGLVVILLAALSIIIVAQFI